MPGILHQTNDIITIDKIVIRRKEWHRMLLSLEIRRNFGITRKTFFFLNPDANNSDVPLKDPDP
jgi:hypothetical protein